MVQKVKLSDLNIDDITGAIKKGILLKTNDTTILNTPEYLLNTRLVKETTIEEDGYLLIQEETVAKYYKTNKYIDYLKTEYRYSFILKIGENSYKYLNINDKKVLKSLIEIDESSKKGYKVNKEKLYKLAEFESTVTLTVSLINEWLKTTEDAVIYYYQNGYEKYIPLTVGLLANIVLYGKYKGKGMHGLFKDLKEWDILRNKSKLAKLAKKTKKNRVKKIGLTSMDTK